MMNLKNRYYRLKLNRRYKEFKNCSLPFPFWDKKRDTFEWVYYDESRQGGYDIQTSLYEALGNVSSSGVTYHYEAVMYGRKNPNQKTPKYQLMESHCHSFDEIVRCVYSYPESFHIPDACLKEYSEQELRCLNKMQSYLKAIGLKDEHESKEIKDLNKKWEEIDKKNKKSIADRLFLLHYSKKWEKIRKKDYLKRYNNELSSLYSSYYPLYTEKEGVSDAYLSGKKDYILRRKYSFHDDTEVGNRYMLVNASNEYCGVLEVISEEFIPFKELKKDMVDYKLAGYKSFKEYKEHLYNDYQERGKMVNEEFTEDSLLIYLKVKVLKKF